MFYAYLPFVFISCSDMVYMTIRKRHFQYGYGNGVFVWLVIKEACYFLKEL